MLNKRLTKKCMSVLLGGVVLSTLSLYSFGAAGGTNKCYEESCDYCCKNDDANCEVCDNRNVELPFEAVVETDGCYESDNSNCGDYSDENLGLTFELYTENKTAKIVSVNSNMSNVLNISTISHNGIEYTVTEIAEGVFESCENLTSVCLQNVINIGERAFMNCVNLMSVELPNATNCGNYVFVGCENLKSVGLQKLTIVKDAMFENCIRLNQIQLPEAEGIDSWAFIDCKALEEVVAPKCKNLGEEAFVGCNKLKSITISLECDEFDKKKVFDDINRDIEISIIKK